MTLWFYITGSLVVGLVAKFFIFRHIFTTKIAEQPINALLFTYQEPML
jgi:uncharacterized protein YneF (UPF0154 family)